MSITHAAYTDKILIIPTWTLKTIDEKFELDFEIRKKSTRHLVSINYLYYESNKLVLESNIIKEEM